MDEKIPTFEELRALFAETRAQMAENSKQLAENSKQLAENSKQLAENAKKSAEIDAQLAQVGLRLDAVGLRLDEVGLHIDRVTKNIDKHGEQIDKLFKEIGGLGNNNGLVAEEIVYHSLEKNMTFAGVKFDSIDHGLVRSRKLPDGKRVTGEYDVLLYNGTSAALIEVKHRIGQEALDRLIKVQLPRFRTVFPQYKDSKMYLGLSGMSFEKGIAEKARDLGIATLTLSGDAVEINDEGVKAW